MTDMVTIERLNEPFDVLPNESAQIQNCKITFDYELAQSCLGVMNSTPGILSVNIPVELTILDGDGELLECVVDHSGEEHDLIHLELKISPQGGLVLVGDVKYQEHTFVADFGNLKRVKAH